MRGTSQWTNAFSVIALLFAQACALAPDAPSTGAASVPASVVRQLLMEEPSAQLHKLSQISDMPSSLARTFLSPAHRKAAQQLKQWMQAAGMESWVDILGNVHGVVNGSCPSGTPALLIGSHYDTVLDAGAFDGPLGVIVGIAAVKLVLLQFLAAAKGSGTLAAVTLADGSIRLPATDVADLLPYPVHIVAFTDEEGVAFQSTFMGSRAVAGTLLQHGMLSSKNKAGQTLEEVLRAEGADDPAAAVAALRIPASSIAEYVEVHIEQGPVLERSNSALGVVSAIAGQTRLWVTVQGEQGHAGTVPMIGRKDALAAAAVLIAEIESLCLNGPQDANGVALFEDFLAQNLVCTVGELHVWPGASNVIPSRVEFSVDVRCKDDGPRQQVLNMINLQIQLQCARRHVSCQVQNKHDAGSVAADARVMQRLLQAAQDAQRLLMSAGLVNEGQFSIGGLSPAHQEVPVLVSGAGHDAMALADIAPMGMLFVRCAGGISHAPQEHASDADIAAATAALASFLLLKVVSNSA